MFKKKDLFIIIVIIVIICLGLLFNHFYFNQAPALVKISINNQEYQRVSLNKNQTININNCNTVVIKDGFVFMSKANCPDKLCIDQGKISKNGEQIICLPNQIVIAIISNQNDDIDATVK